VSRRIPPSKLAWLSGAFALAAVGGPACGGETGGDTTGVPIDGGISDDGLSGSSDGADDGGTRLDSMQGTTTAGDAGSDGGTDMGCAAIDFLFVIDNSGSMGDNQQALVSSFAPFINTILSSVEAGADYHVMVAKTDAGWMPFECLVFCNIACPEIASYCANPAPPDACADQLGAGVTFPIGGDASNTQCQLASGQRWMDSSQADPYNAFQCIAQVGTDGDSDERPMEALIASLSPTMQNAPGCNQGFLRDDAILVVTIITDEADSSSPGSPDGWYQNLLAAKNLDPNAFVLLGLINDTDAASPVCPAGAQDPVRLREFINMFPNKVFGSVCNINGYEQFFQDAVGLIGETCDGFIPPG
jgi:hypothetical protein